MDPLNDWGQPSTASTKRLIVNADDFGRTPGVNEGTIEAHLNGIVSSATVMVLEKAAREGIRQAIERAPKLGLGLHFMSDGRRGAGFGAHRPFRHWRRAGGCVRNAELLPATIPEDEIRRELLAQIALFELAAGRPPSHIDSHHHCALHPSVQPVVAGVAQGRGMPLRAASPQARDELRAAGLTVPDFFLRTFYAEGVTFEKLASLIFNVPLWLDGADVPSGARRCGAARRQLLRERARGGARAALRSGRPRAGREERHRADRVRSALKVFAAGGSAEAARRAAEVMAAAPAPPGQARARAVLRQDDGARVPGARPAPPRREGAVATGVDVQRGRALPRGFGPEELPIVHGAPSLPEGGACRKEGSTSCPATRPIPRTSASATRGSWLAPAGSTSCLLGIGSNGHIAYLEPGRALPPRTARVRLAASTRRGLARDGVRPAPREALTMGIETILSARRDPSRRNRALEGCDRRLMPFIGRVTPRCPASYLSLHPRLTVILDRSRRGELSPSVKNS